MHPVPLETHPHQDPLNMTPEQCAEQLDAHPDFRVLRRLPQRDVFQVAPASAPVARGVVLDTETTGLSSDHDRVIELGMLLFEFNPVTGEVYRIVERFDRLEDPGRPIPPETIRVHHITDEMVRGQRIDDAEVERFLRGVQVVIAHNAAFDRPFVEQRWPLFENLLWACSLRDIDWSAEGFGSAKLEYLLYTQGVFYDAHRAETDCQALLDILSRALPNSQKIALLSLLETLNQPQTRVYAINSPFETKDQLKLRGYRWDGEMRCWHRTLSGAQALAEETAWLKKRVYGERKAVIEVETLGGSVRYSNRSGQKERVAI
jgi:DNA polymerase-3 subunit epsilon